MTQTVSIRPAAVDIRGVASHVRATVTNAAQTLEACTGAAIPTIDGRPPDAVYLGTEPGAGSVYFTWDGASTPAATLGFVLGSNASPTYIPIANGLRTGQINLIASTNPTYVQVKYEWGA